jgi:S1-C subfamily serine protease
MTPTYKAAQSPLCAIYGSHRVYAMLPPDTACTLHAGKGASSGVGFAIPIDTVKGLVDQILTYGRVLRPSLGVVLAPPQALQRLGEQGVLVLDVS